MNAVTTVLLELSLEAPAASRAPHTRLPVHPRCTLASLLLRLLTTFFQHLGSSCGDSDYRSAPRRLALFRPNKGSTLSIPTKEKKIEQLSTKQYTQSPMRFEKWQRNEDTCIRKPLAFTLRGFLLAPNEARPDEMTSFFCDPTERPSRNGSKLTYDYTSLSYLEPP